MFAIYVLNLLTNLVDRVYTFQSRILCVENLERIVRMLLRDYNLLANQEIFTSYEEDHAQIYRIFKELTPGYIFNSQRTKSTPLYDIRIVKISEIDPGIKKPLKPVFEPTLSNLSEEERRRNLMRELTTCKKPVE